MKKSITAKYTIILSSMLILTIFLCWLANRTFLVKYYENSKCEALADVFHEMKGYVENLNGDLMLSQWQNDEIERVSSAKNVSAYIIAENFWGQKVAVYPSGDKLSKDTLAMMKDRWAQYALGNVIQQNYDSDVMVAGNEYAIVKVKDSRMDLEYMDLVANYNNEYVIFLRTNYDSIEENVGLSNKFLAYIGIITTFFGAILMYFTSRRMTKPIKELNDVAKSMTSLDFDVRYQGSSGDEIGELGRSINLLSDKLRDTISELKAANNELQKDIEKKTQIDEMRKEFLSNVTHELKTPIALIQGYAEGLQDNITEDQESREFYCEVIVDEANKMNTMVKKLLSLNQIEFGNDFVEFDRFNIIPVIQSVLSSTEILMKQKGVEVIFNAAEPVYVWADEYLVQEVITNYISNAINHVSGRNLIEVKVLQKDQVVRVTVFNTGEPIPEEELDKIWVKFYKVDKARTREYGGSGIGLSIVKAIMNSLNRECGVNNYDNGVEFWFELDRKVD